MTHTDRYLFVGDARSHSILVYSLERNWAFVRAIGSKGSGPGQFHTPLGMCVYRDRLIVCDSKNLRLQIIDISAADAKDWRFDGPFGLESAETGPSGTPWDVCAANDLLFVAEFELLVTGRVQTFAFSLDALTREVTLTPRSLTGDDFEFPRALACTSNASRVFVADDNRISCIDRSAGTVRSFVNSRPLCVDGELLFAAHGGCLSVIDIAAGAVQRLDAQSWRHAGPQLPPRFHLRG